LGSSPFGGIMARRQLKLYGKKATADDILLEINNLLYAKGHRRLLSSQQRKQIIPK